MDHNGNIREICDHEIHALNLTSNERIVFPIFYVTFSKYNFCLHCHMHTVKCPDYIKCTTSGNIFSNPKSFSTIKLLGDRLQSYHTRYKAHFSL